MKKIILIGGTAGLTANDETTPAGGEFARELLPLFKEYLAATSIHDAYSVNLVLTRSADTCASIETAQDVAQWVDEIVADPDVRVLVFDVTNPAREHLHANGPGQLLLGRVRRERKDIFVVGVDRTTGMGTGTRYAQALSLLKTNSLNLVLAYDSVPGHYLIAAPEETRYGSTSQREFALAFLTRMTVSRMQNRFTRSTVVPGDAVEWTSDAVPANLREVVDHCIKAGAYKPVLGKTAGHFAVKAGDGELLTSIRKTNFNQLKEVGLVRIVSTSEDEVIAHGFRPSVGGQSQRIIFGEHPRLDCIVHFHCPMRDDAPLRAEIPVKEQWPNECGSHECGRATSRGLAEVDLGDGDSLSVVYLDAHGPNIVFNRSTPADKIRTFIDANFDLGAKTGGIAATRAH
jgi:hypothetical protein